MPSAKPASNKHQHTSSRPHNMNPRFPLKPGHQVLRRWEHAGVGRRQFIAQTVLTHTNGCAPNQLNFAHSVCKIASTTIAPVLKLNLAVVEAVLFAHDVEPRIRRHCRNR